MVAELSENSKWKTFTVIANTPCYTEIFTNQGLFRIRVESEPNELLLLVSGGGKIECLNTTWFSSNLTIALENSRIVITYTTTLKISIRKL